MSEHIGKQTGSALIISLVILIVMTVIGLTAMSSSTLQERMAGNSRDMTLSFQSTEAALRGGETWLLANNPPPGAYKLDNPAAWDGGGEMGSETGFSPPLADDPRYHVGEPQLVFDSIMVGSGSTPPREFYPVTARGVGGADTTVTIIRSMFEPW